MHAEGGGATGLSVWPVTGAVRAGEWVRSRGRTGAGEAPPARVVEWTMTGAGDTTVTGAEMMGGDGE